MTDQTEIERFEVGQQVVINDWYVRGWQPGEIVKVGRTLVHIRYESWGDPTPFRIDTQRGNNRNSNATFRTLQQHDRELRTREAWEQLRQHGFVPLGYGTSKPSLEVLEAIVAAIEHEKAAP